MLPSVCVRQTHVAADLSCRTIRRIALPSAAVYTVLVHIGGAGDVDMRNVSV